MASYYVHSGAGGTNNGTSWANAYLTLTSAFSGKVAGDLFYVAHDHAESTAGAVTLTPNGSISNPSKIICVNRAGSVPPVSADRRATATVTTTTNASINFSAFAHYDGIIFIAGSGSSGASQIQFGSGSAPSWIRCDNCSLRLAGTGTTNKIIFGGATNVFAILTQLNNTTMSFGAVGQGINFGNRLEWRDTPSALLNTIPTTLFTPIAGWGGAVECIGVDLSAAGSGKTIVGALATALPANFRFIDCKLDASVTKSAVPLSHGSTEIDFVRSGASGVNYAVHRHRVGGLLTEETTIVRTGGASDGTTAIAWKIITTANCHYTIPFECPPIAIWNDTTGSAVTATVEGIGAALPTDAEIWLDVEYLGDASSPQGSFVNDARADLIATAANQTTSSETWGGSTSAFKLAVTFTAQQRGWIYARVKIGKASATYYIDPLVTLT